MGWPTRDDEPRPKPGPNEHQPCKGFPDGHHCPVYVEGTIYCNACRSLRQEMTAMGLVGRWVPAGIVLEDLAAPILTCKCGGDAEAPQHERSLLHLKWAWTHPQK